MCFSRFLTLTQLAARFGVDLFEMRRRMRQAGLINEDLTPSLEAFGENLCRLRWRSVEHKQHVWTWHVRKTSAALTRAGQPQRPNWFVRTWNRLREILNSEETARLLKPRRHPVVRRPTSRRLPRKPANTPA